MKKWYVHGTSKECADKIRNEGFGGEKTWLLSNDEVYIREVFLDNEEINEENIIYAIENAQITAALHGSLNPSISLIFMLIDEDTVYPDMTYGAIETDKCITYDVANNLDKSEFKEIVISNGYDIYNRYFYLQSLNMDNLNLDYLSDSELNILKAYKEGEFNSSLYDLLMPYGYDTSNYSTFLKNEKTSILYI